MSFCRIILNVVVGSIVGGCAGEDGVSRMIIVCLAFAALQHEGKVGGEMGLIDGFRGEYLLV